MHQPDYTAYVEARTLMKQWRIEVRAPIDWLSVQMSVEELGIESPYPKDTLHDHLLRQRDAVVLPRYVH
jgi:hypothetical protein